MVNRVFYIPDELFYHQRGDLFLVILRTPPIWAIVNLQLKKFMEALPIQKAFTLDDILKDRIYDVESDHSVASLLDSLVDCGICYCNTDHLIQPERDLRINGVYFELTSRCNLRCKHCYVDAGEKGNVDHLSKEEILRTIYQLTPPSDIGFSGGEPLMREDCMDMLREVTLKGYNCTLLSNGLLITQEIANELSQLKVTVQISLEGSTKEVHDKIRGKGTFDKTLTAIDRLVYAGCKVRISFTPTRLNYTDFRSLIALCREHGVKSAHVCTYTPQGRGKENRDLLQLNSEQLHEFQKTVYAESKDFDIMGNLPETLDLDRVGYLWDKCPLGGSIHVGYDGSIYPCEIASESEFIIGNIKNDLLQDILASPQMRYFVENSRKRIHIIHDCSVCEWKHFCGGGCMVISSSGNGEINSSDYLCESRKFWFEELLWSKFEK